MGLWEANHQKTIDTYHIVTRNLQAFKMTNSKYEYEERHLHIQLHQFEDRKTKVLNLSPYTTFQRKEEPPVLQAYQPEKKQGKP